MKRENKTANMIPLLQFIFSTQIVCLMRSLGKSSGVQELWHSFVPCTHLSQKTHQYYLFKCFLYGSDLTHVYSKLIIFCLSRQCI